MAFPGDEWRLQILGSELTARRRNYTIFGMKKSLRLSLGAFVLFGLVYPTLASPEDGYRSYKTHEYDRALEQCKGQKDLLSRLVMGLASAEKAGLYKNKADRQQAAMYLKILAVDVKMDDLPVLERFLNLEGAVFGNKEAAKLFEKAINTARTPEQVLVLARYLDPARGPAVNKLALGPIIKRLKPVRDYVGKGGSMPEQDRALFTNPKLLQPLVTALARKETASAARKALTLIEEPALPYLEKMEMTPAVSAAVVDIKKAITRRQTKQPDSTWFSAYGR